MYNIYVDFNATRLILSQHNYYFNNYLKCGQHLINYLIFLINLTFEHPIKIARTFKILDVILGSLLYFHRYY